MSDVERQILNLYASIPPYRLQDAKFYMSAETRDLLAPKLTKGVPVTAYGVPFEIDENMPIGIVNMSVETGVDRWVKRQREAGRTVNIVKPADFSPTVLPVSDPPTLRALLRHWTRKVFKR